MVKKSIVVPEGQAPTHVLVVSSANAVVPFIFPSQPVLQKLTFVIPEPDSLSVGGLAYGLPGGQEVAATHVCVSGFHTGVAPEHAVTQSLADAGLPVPVYILPGGHEP